MKRDKDRAPAQSPVPSPIPPTPDQFFAVAGVRSATSIINRYGTRPLACLVLLCVIAACGSQRNHAPASTLAADAALRIAMTLENVPTSWNDNLRFIMGKESRGQVGIQNPSSSARGLFQLTAANYHMNPSGTASFGNPVEEAQGGIRYIKQRYGTAENAVAHWQQNHWY